VILPETTQTDKPTQLKDECQLERAKQQLGSTQSSPPVLLALVQRPVLALRLA
jgi:hypothetical protein